MKPIYLFIICLAFWLNAVASLFAESSSQNEVVTAQDYCDFLNNTVETDSYFFYDEKMGSDFHVACITRQGIPGSYEYFVIAGRDNIPIRFVNESAKAAYCDWAKNGQSIEGPTDKDLSLRSNQNEFIINAATPSVLTLAIAPTSSEKSNSFLSKKNILAVSIIIGGAFITHGMTEEGIVLSSEASTQEQTMVPRSDSSLESNSHEVAIGRTDERIREKENETCDEKKSSLTMVAMDKVSAHSSPLIDPSIVESKGILKKEGKLGVSTLRQTSRGGSPDSPIRFKSDADEFFDSSGNIKEFKVVSGDKNLRRVSFDLVPNEEEFTGLVKNLRTSIKALYKRDPEYSAKLASLYTAAYPQAKAFVETLKASIQNDPALQNERNARFLATATIKTIEIAAKTINQQTFKPIKDRQPVLPSTRVKPVELPVEIVKSDKIEIIDRNDQIAVIEANSSIENLREIKEVLNPPLDNKGAHLRQVRIQRANEARSIACFKEISARVKARSFFDFHRRNTPSNEYIQAEAEQNKATSYYEECLQAYEITKTTLPLTDPQEAIEAAIADILELSEKGLQAADELKTMIASDYRKIY